MVTYSFLKTKFFIKKLPPYPPSRQRSASTVMVPDLSHAQGVSSAPGPCFHHRLRIPPQVLFHGGAADGVVEVAVAREGAQGEGTVDGDEFAISVTALGF